MTTAKTTNREHWTPFMWEIERFLREKSLETMEDWTRLKLASLMHVSPSTVHTWYRKEKPTVPDAKSFWRLVRVTGWTPEHLLSMMPYDKLPFYVPDEWEFLHEQVQERWGYDPGLAAQIAQWFDEMQRAYEQMPKRVPATPATPATAARAGVSEDAPVRSVEIDFGGEKGGERGESKATNTARKAKRPRATAVR